ncbi:unnamed protein product [Camellia sinensis]
MMQDFFIFFPVLEQRNPTRNRVKDIIMFSVKSPSFLLLPVFVIFSSTLFYSFSDGASQNLHLQTIHISGIANESEYGVVSWGSRWSVLEGPSLFLAAERTHRKDPFDNFKYYTGGWNISDHHYFYSIGCVVLYTGQGKFHTSTSNTLDYVVWQANTTVESLGSVLDYLEAAKHIRADQLFLPPDVQNNINKVETDINTATTALEHEARRN